jgi:hypothetical protein
MTHRSILIAAGATSAAALLSLVAAACGGNRSKTGFSPTSSDAGVVQAAAGDGAGGVAPGPGQAAGGPTAEGGNAAIPTSGAPTGFVRLAVWTPDAPAGGYDVCLMSQGNNSQWMGPLHGMGVTFPSVGRYVAVPPGMYNAGVMPAGNGCGAPVNGIVGLPMIVANGRATVAIIGDITPMGNDQAAKVVTFADDVTGLASRAAVRFIDALPGATDVIFGTGSETNITFAALTGNVPFGGVSSSPADGGMADINGYLLLNPVVGATLSAHVPTGEVDISSSTSFGNGGIINNGGPPGIVSSANDLATGVSASWGSGSAVTIALVHANTGGALAQFLVCQDDAPPTGPSGALSACTTLSQ